MKKAMLYILSFVGLIVLGLIVTLIILSPGKPRQFLDANGNKLANSISEKIFIEINGSKQGMFIKSKKPGQPCYLILAWWNAGLFFNRKISNLS